MATYHKGTLYLNSELNEVGYWLGSREMGSQSIWYDEYAELQLSKLENKEKNILDRFLYDFRKCTDYVMVTDKQVNEILVKIFEDGRISQGCKKKMKIIFEEFVDEQGVVYGKELQTGLVFPIIPKKSDFRKEIFKVKRQTFRVFDNELYYYKLKMIENYNFPSLTLCDAMILGSYVANQNEILEYQNKFSKGFNKKKRQEKFENEVRKWYNKNVYNCEIVPKKEEVKEKKELISQSSETKVMDNIEYLLMKLKKVNNELYSKYQNEYNELLSGLTGDNLINLRPTTLLGFQSLEASIEIELFTNKHQANSILECLNTLEKEYLNNVLTGADKKTSITFNELERISELFLKIKNRYNLLEQRNVLKKIGFIYLMEVKENIDSFLVNDLENSYFKEYLKTMLIHIDALKELGIIKSNILIDLNNDLNVASVLEIIKNIEFNVYEKEKVNELVKRLEY